MFGWTASERRTQMETRQLEASGMLIDAVRRELAPVVSQVAQIAASVDELKTNRVTRTDFERLQSEVRQAATEVDRRFYSREFIDQMARQRDNDIRDVRGDLDGISKRLDAQAAATASTGERLFSRAVAIAAAIYLFVQLMPHLVKLFQ